MVFLLNDKPIALDAPFTTEDGTQYPSNWIRLASPEERAAIGITEAPDPEAYDQRFYWGPGNPKDLDGLKSQWIGQVKQTAGSMLAQSDWMVIRKVEREVEIPAETVLFRAAVLAEATRLESAVTASTTVEELIAAVSAQSWPTVGSPAQNEEAVNGS